MFDHLAWAEAHGLPIITRPCSKCGVEFTANEKYETKTVAGLKAPLHECGKRYQLKVILPKNLRERREWKRFAENLSVLLKKS